MTRQFDKYCRELEMADLESEVPCDEKYEAARKAHMERIQLLLNVADRARKGETVVLLYPMRDMLRIDFSDCTPKDAVINRSGMFWWFPSAGRVFFRDISIGPEYLQGLLADFVWVDDAQWRASSRLLDLVTYRNSVYRHRMNSRYPIDESDC